jgi:hypothetical protein
MTKSLCGAAKLLRKVFPTKFTQNVHFVGMSVSFRDGGKTPLRASRFSKFSGTFGSRLDDSTMDRHDRKNCNVKTGFCFPEHNFSFSYQMKIVGSVDC